MVSIEDVFQAMEADVEKFGEAISLASKEYINAWAERFGQMPGYHFNEAKSLMRRPILVFLTEMRRQLLKSLPVDSDVASKLEKQDLLITALRRRLVDREMGHAGHDYGRKKSSSTKQVKSEASDGA